MRFTGLQPLAYQGQIDVVLDELGEVDLRNQARVVGVRFIPRQRDFSVFVDFQLDEPRADTLVYLEFTNAEILRVVPETPTMADPHYGYDLLRDLTYWKDRNTGREGCTVTTTNLEIDLCTPEVKAHVVHSEGMAADAGLL